MTWGTFPPRPRELGETCGTASGHHREGLSLAGRSKELIDDLDGDPCQQRRQRRSAARRPRGADRGARGRAVPVARHLRVAERHPQHVRPSRASSASARSRHHRTTYSFDADHPEIFASEDNGATPVEYVLVGLAGCLTAGVAAVAQNREIQLRSVSATIEGDMDVRGILGIDSDVRNGFSGIKVTYDIDADATPGRDQGARRPVAEALGRLRHHHQPDERHGRGQLTASARRGRPPCAPRPSSSGPATPGSR